MVRLPLLILRESGWDLIDERQVSAFDEPCAKHGGAFSRYYFFFFLAGGAAGSVGTEPGGGSFAHGFAFGASSPFLAGASFGAGAASAAGASLAQGLTCASSFLPLPLFLAAASVGFASGAGSFEPEHAPSKSAEAAAMMMDRFMAEISCYRPS
ncbi:MAG: hypothetical protein KA233_06185 [Novosphingobium sp.]|nr:hypothetical protein [Novosphingobium sp.]MBP6555255.1 hypothetical protein [Novosphingobium sp.]